jgi:hypothetical protein
VWFANTRLVINKGVVGEGVISAFHFSEVRVFDLFSLSLLFPGPPFCIHLALLGGMGVAFWTRYFFVGLSLQANAIVWPMAVSTLLAVQCLTCFP